MLKTMKNQMLPERGEGCRCKGKTPKTLCYVTLCYEEIDISIPNFINNEYAALPVCYSRLINFKIRHS